MLLTIVAIGISAFDIIIQALYYPEKENMTVIIAGGSYFLMGFIAVILGFSRLFTVKRALNDIPKSQVPISEKDIPKFVHNLIVSELTRVSRIALAGEPRPEDGGRPGWGRPGSSYHNIHFRSSIIETLSLIEQQAVRSSENFARQPSMSVQRYIDFLIEHKKIDRELGHAYVEGYERARFSDDEVPEEQYIKFMKLVLQLLRQFGFNGN
ncbi:300_t:CDS:2 [Funneliformis geosporum]|uniref:Defect at low temperature protein 1 n=1 Tax=Funneliformis geosporum TaxID=1117311 RepID=A0A9W4SEE3_9GLOM|nr:300_t:CDS:2 [Funneliformis geosporum]CAI2165290.1 15132_t:CDS:2 [Funneliformis geosporum]